LNKSVSSSSTMSFQNSTKFTLGQKIGFNVEFVASSEISWSIETSFTTTNTEQTTKTDLKGWNTDIPIPANQEVRINVFSYAKEVDVPMYYRVSMYDPITQAEIDHVMEQGTFKGVLYSSLIIEPNYYNLDGTPVNAQTRSSVPNSFVVTRKAAP
ncbi:MAG: ETX/MTX2 family pore-forming toxin, partial [Phycisphaerae bacterium]|nr:ETX/MTX2 family pore-forming toxin [Saprospiraceae bacterium]